MTASRVEEQVIGNNGGNSGILGTTITPASDSQRVEEIDPARFGMVSESIGRDNEAIGTDYFPSAAGLSMLGFKSMSITGNLVTSGILSTLIIEVRNTTSGTWVPIALGVDDSGVLVASQKNGAPFTWDFDDLNKMYFRFALTVDHATNTNELDLHRTPV